MGAAVSSSHIVSAAPSSSGGGLLTLCPSSSVGSLLREGGGSVVELAGVGSVGHRGRFWQLLTEATPVAPLLPKPCHSNPLHIVSMFRGL